ncbi:MAG: NAD-dependent epimerase/dehydratase family protein [Muribaculaceae bacterium]|nr:NAD-dependent epimerase/dehydratase family protein [Muribaculaceae bacterium]
MARILITGGAGFIGSNTALRLVKAGHDVVVLDSLSQQIHGDDPSLTSPLYRSIEGKVEFIKGSVTSREDLERSLEGVEIVLHLAAETGTGQSMYEISKYVDVNIGGTALLLDILANKKTSVRRVVVAESRAIYGEGRYWSEELQAYVYPGSRDDAKMSEGDFEVKYPGCKAPLTLVGTTEDSEIHPGSVYGITKQVQGQLVHLVCKTLGIESVSLRYQNVYGPGQSLSNPYTGILSIFSTRIRNGKGINIFEDGKESRDFVYIDDIVEANMLALFTPGISGEAFNIGTGVATDVNTVAAMLCKNYNKDVTLTISGNYRSGDIRHNYADISKARRMLGFTPKWSFSEGISEFCRWVESQPAGEDGYDRSIEEMRKKGLYK